MIKIKTYSIKELYLNKGVVSIFIKRFWDEVYSQISNINNKHLMILVKVQYSDSELGYRTLGHLRRVNFEDKNLFIDYIVERLSILNDSYTSLSLSDITFTYIIRDGLAKETNIQLTELENKNLTWHRFLNLNLPISMNPSEYGIIVSKSNIEGYTRYIVRDIKKIFQIDVSIDQLINNVTLFGVSDLKWTDTKLSDVFKREINKSTIYFLDGEIILRKQILNAKPFSKVKPEKSLITNFVTMDIETIKLDNQLTPYLICAYNGVDYIQSYATSNLNQEELFKIFITKLVTLFKGRILRVYAHNLSNFDGVFLLKHLIPFGEVKPLYYNGRLMSIKIKLTINGPYYGRTIIFKDSYLLLPYTLRNLCDAFNLNVVKGYFPFNLNDIFYSGLFPKFNFWSDITPQEYNNLKQQFKNKMWSFQLEAIKYCKLVTCGG